jgi:hypothetical protein
MARTGADKPGASLDSLAFKLRIGKHVECDNGPGAAETSRILHVYGGKQQTSS